MRKVALDEYRQSESALTIEGTEWNEKGRGYCKQGRA